MSQFDYLRRSFTDQLPPPPANGSTGWREKRADKAFSKSAADYYVESLPSLPHLSAHPTHPIELHAGLLPAYPGGSNSEFEGATGKDAELFFMMIRGRRSAGRGRVVFWFNGGPGCSSFDGALMEVGPFRTIPASKTSSGDVELTLVDGWDEFATIVFVDQPAGTGLSYVPTDGYIHELSQAATEFVTFLEHFYEVFPELKNQDTYLAGESYAGQYIPYFGSAILDSKRLDLPLKGLAIGNGWVDPREQYRGYAEFAYARGLVQKGSREAQHLDDTMTTCQAALDQVEQSGFIPVNVDDCAQVMDAVMKPFEQQLNGKSICLNVYDVRLTDDWPACGMNWPPDLPDIYKYLRRKDVLSALHATMKETAWIECDSIVSNQLFNHKSQASALLLPKILDAGVKVMMFAGDEDLICNYVGIERTLERIEWSGGKGMSNATADPWYINGTYAGTWQKRGELEYVRIAGGSHMVGFDLPGVTNDMILRFMGVDYAELAGSTAVLPSRLGDHESALTVGDSSTGSPLPKKIDWNARAHAGSAGLILFLMICGIGAYFFYRYRAKRRKYVGFAGPQDYAMESTARSSEDEEQRVPLEGTNSKRRNGDQDDVVFDIGDED